MGVNLMFQNILGWFKKKPVAPPPAAEKEPPFIVNVDFKVLAEGSLQHAIYWNVEVDQVAVVLGRLLYTITSGALNKELVEILENQENKRFSAIALESWKAMVEEHGPLYEKPETDTDDDPIVPPDQFLNNLKRTIE